MRISDWSSDVCSSDLVLGVPERACGAVARTALRRWEPSEVGGAVRVELTVVVGGEVGAVSGVGQAATALLGDVHPPEARLGETESGTSLPWSARDAKGGLEGGDHRGPRDASALVGEGCTECVGDLVPQSCAAAPRRPLPRAHPWPDR